ncbi:hypothetical protein AS034_15100 [[Bacillus] enclensis]|nr:hypothetical protein AS034_15100 [[Bacillus] enclensis]
MGLCTWYKLKFVYLVQTMGFVPGTTPDQMGAFIGVPIWGARLKSVKLSLAQYTQSEPGSNYTFCAWNNPPESCLTQNTQFVPGTKQANRAWHKNPNPCLAPTNQPQNPNA